MERGGKGKDGIMGELPSATKGVRCPDTTVSLMHYKFSKH